VSSLLTLPGTLLLDETGSNLPVPTLGQSSAPCPPGSSRNILGYCGTSGPQGLAKDSGTLADLPRLATGLLGLMLIAAAIFTHPTVIAVGKRAAEAGAEAAL
jgi:hypothetical protein